MKKIFLTVFSMIMICLMTITPVFASGETRCYDEANLLTGEESRELNEKLNTLSHQYDFDIFVVTAYSLNGKTSTQYADDFFDENKYGMGNGEDGILLLISMENRDWAISTCGFGIEAFTDAGQEYMVDHFKPMLSDGDYYEAFDTFVDLCDDFISQAKTDEPYDSSNMPKGPIQIIWIPIAMVIGSLVSLIIMLGFKSQLKSIRYQPQASDYIKNVKINNQRDIYLYRNVTRTKNLKKLLVEEVLYICLLLETLMVDQVDIFKENIVLFSFWLFWCNILTKR